MQLARRILLSLNSWSIISIIIILITISPILNILANILTPTSENWQYLVSYLVSDYIFNSFILVVFTCVLTCIIGLSLSFIISMFDFPFRNFFKWALVLPLAIPPYIAAYTFNNMLNYTGVVQTFFRTELNLYLNPETLDIMTIEGAILIFTLFLYPYVFIMTRSFLEKQSSSLIESGRMLGKNTATIFFKIIFPLSRVSLIGGSSLVAMEVLNDYGVVKYFGIQTFSTAIFTTWFGMSDSNSALKLSAILIFFVVGFLILEKFLRGNIKYNYSSTKVRPLSRIRLKGIKSIMAFLYCTIIFSISFLIPVIQIILWSIISLDNLNLTNFSDIISNSIIISLFTSILILFAALIYANFNRLSKGKIRKFLPQITSLGYSIPGAVIAMGVITLFITLDRFFYSIVENTTNNTGGLILSGTITVLIFAYFIRFLAIGYNPIESGFEKIGNKFYEASRTMGYGITKTFFKVDLPMLRPALLGAFILIFIDILKELPLTLILRPFNFNTLPIKSFEYANDEMIYQSSVYSLIIISISVTAILLLNIINSRRGKNVYRNK